MVFPPKRYEAGIVNLSDLAGTYKKYDIEKTVIDILYYRNKIGIEETKEIIKNYLQKEDGNIAKMHRLAESLDHQSVYEFSFLTTDRVKYLELI